MAAVAGTLSAAIADDRQLTFVPARGGMGESPEIQANTVCARMAEATAGHFQSLYLPELSSESASTSLRHEPAIAKTLDLIDHANVAIHCVGEAMAMAKRRQMSDEVTATLVERHAVGKPLVISLIKMVVVYRVPKLGLSISDLDRMDLVVAVAGGHSKGAAVEAYFKFSAKHF